ncbi:MAG: formylglycine-generating enzyme family protein [Oscillatoria sp. PMC 1051.18]|nr:formylglycine-generating enzyme family protein [Oscillatoria sp. PMC 1050.18]MEC5033265.1 formylglycine-generating enzyme family protein [Oscillatoria sp. PMC 1051.18]
MNSIYAYQGTVLPPKYGKLKLNQWASKWLTKDGDSELIPYIEKWRQICFSTERINSERAIQAVQKIYKLMDYPEPEILLFDSPGAVIHKMDDEENFSEDLGKSLASEFRKRFGDVFLSSLQNQLDGIWLKLADEILNFPSQLDAIQLKSNEPTYQLSYFRQSSIVREFLETTMNFLWTYDEEDYEDCDEDEEDEDRDEEFSFPLKDSEQMIVNWDEILASNAARFSPQENNRMSAVLDCNIVVQFFARLCEIDFCVSELKCNLDLPKWNAWKKLMTHSGSVWFYENACIICDRPTKISFDDQGRLHGEGSPAVQFADGFSVYAFQNVRLPEKYGRVHPSQWKSQWLLEGNYADITQILIENIGYERINRELNEYSLTPQDKYELLKTNLYDKVDLSNNVTSSQEPARNYINLKSLPSYEFEVVSVNFKGEMIATEKKQAQVFTEDLGNNITLEMVAIPGGEFMMGSMGNGGEENPQHLVKVSPFFLSKYPITQAQWRAVASMPKIKLDLDLEPSHFQCDTRPVESITKQEAIEFCARIWQYTGRLYSLPTEAQWEYACRANTTTPFYFGETITTDLANYNGEKYSYKDEPSGNFRQETLPVGSFPPNAFGLFDLHGNVFEFCADNWHEDYKDAPTDGKSRIGGNDEYVPIRGGGWKSKAFRCRSANRNDDFRKDDIIYRDVGFRVCSFI